MKLYVGIDLHSTNNVTVVQDEEDRVITRGRLANDLRTVLAWLEPKVSHTPARLDPDE